MGSFSGRGIYAWVIRRLIEKAPFNGASILTFIVNRAVNGWATEIWRWGSVLMSLAAERPDVYSFVMTMRPGSVGAQWNRAQNITLLRSVPSCGIDDSINISSLRDETAPASTHVPSHQKSNSSPVTRHSSPVTRHPSLHSCAWPRLNHGTADRVGRCIDSVRD